jgi:transcriptional regulator with XRE-family HTH domain
MSLRIKEVIKEKELTIQSLADKMGINRVNLSSSINGNPTVETLSKIADALDVHISELFENPKENTTTCPHCGKPISVKIEKE